MNWPQLFARKKYYPNLQIFATNFCPIFNCSTINFRKGKWPLISSPSCDSACIVCSVPFLAARSAVVRPDGLSRVFLDAESLASKTYVSYTLVFTQRKMKQVPSRLETGIHDSIRSRVSRSLPKPGLPHTFSVPPRGSLHTSATVSAHTLARLLIC